SYSSYFFTPKSKTSGNLIIATCFNQFSFYGVTPTIDIEPNKTGCMQINAYTLLLLIAEKIFENIRY
ncbi:MAG: hypothetical protein UC379_05835, partial [Acutalibacteraceae bacterium]|nr:hypothetical protein [Acutalibacteraceae bacterium]